MYQIDINTNTVQMNNTNFFDEDYLGKVQCSIIQDISVGVK